MLRYRCASRCDTRIFTDLPCDFACEVWAEQKPCGCLRYPSWARWEVVKDSSQLPVVLVKNLGGGSEQVGR